MRPETAISLAMLSLVWERSGRDVGLRENIISKLEFLRCKNVSVPGIRIRSGIEGPVSNEVSDFVGRLAIAGFVVQESPIKLTSNGLKLLKQRTSEQLGDPEVSQAAEVLGLTPDVLEKLSLAVAQA